MSSKLDYGETSSVARRREHCLSLGADVIVFTTSATKTADAIRLGATEAMNSRNHGNVQKHASTFDFILDTVPAKHNINAYQSAQAR